MAHLQRLAPVLIAVGSPRGPGVVCQEDVNEVDDCGFACGIACGFIASHIARDLEIEIGHQVQAASVEFYKQLQFSKIFH